MKVLTQTDKFKELLIDVYQKANGGASFEEVMNLMQSELYQLKEDDENNDIINTTF